MSSLPDANDACGVISNADKFTSAFHQRKAAHLRQIQQLAKQTTDTPAPTFNTSDLGPRLADNLVTKIGKSFSSYPRATAPTAVSGTKTFGTKSFRPRNPTTCLTTRASTSKLD